MSSRGQHGDKEDVVDKEDFYDCQDTLETPDQRDEEKVQTDTQTDVRQENERGDRLQEDKLKDDGQQDELRNEDVTQNDGAQDDGLQEDSDSDLKEDKGPGLEFDDDYLREMEKELTDTEKESRRQQSLALKEKGNSLFKAGDWVEAQRSYTEALVLCPLAFSQERAVLFSNRAAARLHLDMKDQAISDCTRAIDLNPDYVRALLRRAELYEQTEKLDEALEDYKKVLERDPNHTAARQACMVRPLPPERRRLRIDRLMDIERVVIACFSEATSADP